MKFTKATECHRIGEATSFSYFKTNNADKWEQVNNLNKLCTKDTAK